jgi:hypothetical protein
MADSSSTPATASLAALLHAIAQMGGERGRKMMESLTAVTSTAGRDGDRASMPELAALTENPGDESRAHDLALALHVRADEDRAFGERLDTWRGQPAIRALERHLTRLASVTAGADDLAGPASSARAKEPAGSPADPEQSEASPGRPWKRFLANTWTVTVAGGVIVGLIVLFATRVLPGGSPAPAAGGTGNSGQAKTAASAAALQARIEWCCQLTAAEGEAGFIWPKSYGDLEANVRAGSVNLTHATHAGVGLIEISLQTDSAEPIYVAPPEVVVQGRARRPAQGLLLTYEYTPQGAGIASQFTADVDEGDPVTVPANSATASAPAANPAMDYFYVSQSSPEIMMLQVVDRDYFCHFSILLKWRSGGRTYQHQFVNDGQSFTMAGSAGLRNYVYNPILGTLKAS